MSKKVYQQKNQFATSTSIRIDVKGKSQSVTFESKRKNGILTYETDNAEIQAGIEATNKYLSGAITCIEGAKSSQQSTVNSQQKEKVENTDVTEFPEVVEFQSAKEILRNDPYNVPFQGLNTPAGILKKAEEVGVSFPNLKAEA